MQFRLAGYVMSALLLLLGFVLAYIHLRDQKVESPPAPVRKDTIMGPGTKINFQLADGTSHTGSLIETVSTQGGLGGRHGLGVYPENKLRLFAAGGTGSIRLGFAQGDGSFYDAVLVEPSGDIGLGVEPQAKLHVGGNAKINGSVEIGAYVLSSTKDGLQVCRTGGSDCQMLFQEASVP
jgi:hypothetical protein